MPLGGPASMTSTRKFKSVAICNHAPPYQPVIPHETLIKIGELILTYRSGALRVNCAESIQEVMSVSASAWQKPDEDLRAGRVEVGRFE